MEIKQEAQNAADFEDLAARTATLCTCRDALIARTSELPKNGIDPHSPQVTDISNRMLNVWLLSRVVRTHLNRMIMHLAKLHPTEETQALRHACDVCLAELPDYEEHPDVARLHKGRTNSELLRRNR